MSFNCTDNLLAEINLLGTDRVPVAMTVLFTQISSPKREQMTQPDPNDPYHYELTQAENVQFTIVAFKTAKLVTMSFDGTDLPAPYSFSVTKPRGFRHVVASEFDFSPGCDPSAHYDISVSGSAGGSFNVPSIATDTAVKDPGFTFKVIG